MTRNHAHLAINSTHHQAGKVYNYNRMNQLYIYFTLEQLKLILMIIIASIEVITTDFEKSTEMQARKCAINYQ